MTKKILIVDDERFISVTLSRAIRELCDFHGEIRIVANGKEAIEEISHSFYNMCFLDIKLPDLNGLDVMEMINNISPETNVTIMSASFITEEMKKKIEKGASKFIEKPFDLYKAVASVEQAFGRGEAGTFHNY